MHIKQLCNHKITLLFEQLNDSCPHMLPCVCGNILPHSFHNYIGMCFFANLATVLS